jgi:hypothetical protein
LSRPLSALIFSMLFVLRDKCAHALSVESDPSIFSIGGTFAKRRTCGREKDDGGRRTVGRRFIRSLLATTISNARGARAERDRGRERERDGRRVARDAHLLLLRGDDALLRL